MISNMYFVKDDVIGNFQLLGLYESDPIAVRVFNHFCRGEGVPYRDLSLYRTGTFDDRAGELLSTDLEFVKRGEYIEV